MHRRIQVGDIVHRFRYSKATPQGEAEQYYCTAAMILEVVEPLRGECILRDFPPYSREEDVKLHNDKEPGSWHFKDECPLRH